MFIIAYTAEGNHIVIQCSIDLPKLRRINYTSCQPVRSKDADWVWLLQLHALV